jgi:dienelactone hydrolase
MKTRRIVRKRWIVLLVLLLAGSAAAYAFFHEEPPDPRYNGAYRFADGRSVLVTARTEGTLRLSGLDGESRALWPSGENTYTAGPGWSEKAPREVEVSFSPPPEAGGYSPGLTWKRRGGRPEPARRLDLPETHFAFTSDGLELRGKLVRPKGSGPFPAVVIVHGSGRESAVDTYYMPYLFAAHGIATLVYDKRGTGGSEGDYTQNFHVLARDVVAAVEWLRAQSGIDPARIHLAGYSQGGWIAPLAATRIPGIRSLLINYGPMVPVTGEDRWGYVYALKKKGFGEDEIRKADRIDNVIGAIADHREDRWDELGRLLDEAEGEPWFEAVKGSDSALGMVSGTRLPRWVLRLYAAWALRPREEPFIDRLYDPVPTVDSLQTTPSLWLLADEDESMPTGWTVEKLEALRAQGRPINIRVYPGTDHGILRFIDEPDGERRYLGYHPDYLMDQVRWLRSQSGLP